MTTTTFSPDPARRDSGKKVYEDEFALAFHDIAPRRRCMCW
jgi:diadenosine tetraphosphate (Ap4A) HIT family hydrolase